MDRKQRLLKGLDTSVLLGAEIGALCRPFLTPEDGRVIYVDHLSTDDLREKFANDPGVDVDALVPVSAVWGEKSLLESLGTSVDYVVASHVIEHVPDLITWLEELALSLTPSGEVRLIVPDKRFTFDRLRSETQPKDVLYARMIRARRPHPYAVLDYVLNVVKIDAAQAWAGGVDDANLERHHTREHAIACATQAQNGAYHDIHCWVFTPRSFCLLFGYLAEHGLAAFQCTNFHDTEPGSIEFFVGMRPSTDAKACVDSWGAAAEMARN